MLTSYQELLTSHAEELNVISVRTLIAMVDHQQVQRKDLRRWVVNLKNSEEYRHLFRQNMPTKPGWTQVSIPSAGIWGDYDEPTVITIEGAKRLDDVMGQQVINSNIQIAYYFATATEAREWWSENKHKLEKLIHNLKSKIYPLYIPEELD